MYLNHITMEFSELFCGFRFAALFKDEILAKCSKIFQNPYFIKNNIPYNLIKNVLLIEIDLLVWRSITYELNASSSSNLLKGDSPEDRYNYFMAQFSLPSTKDFFFKKYPFLEKYFHSICDNFIAFVIEFSNRIQADINLIGEHFFHVEKCVEIHAMGDPHAGGRRVLKIGFLTTNFEKKYLIYKPRNIGPEKTYNELCHWFSEGLGIELKSQQIIDCGNYAYCEFIEHLPCLTVNEVRNYMYRLGVILHLSYLIGLNDLHYENVIPSGEFPIIVDNECMMSPYITKQDSVYMKDDILFNVLDLCLLPGQYHFSSQADVSAMGVEDKVEQIYDEKFFLNEKTDQLKTGFKKVSRVINTLKPTLGGLEIDLYCYKNQLKKGFSDAYKLTLKCKKNILENHYPVFESLAKCKTRVLLRNTLTYRKIQVESYHPVVLHSHKEFDNYFAVLDPFFKYLPNHIDLVNAEKTDIQLGDIPIFNAYTNETKIFSSKNTILKVKVELSGYELFKNKLQHVFSSKDLFIQKQIIENCLCAYSLTRKKSIKNNHRRSIKKNINSELTLIDHIMKRLNKLLMENNNRATWPTIELLKPNLWGSKLADIDLYSGTTGAGLLYLYSYKLSGNLEYKRVAQKCIFNNLNDRLLFFDKTSFLKDKILGSPGFYTGIGGVIYGLYCLYQIEQTMHIHSKILELLDMMLLTIEFTFDVDLLSGLMGALLSVNLIKDIIPQDKYLLICNTILEKFFKIYPSPELLPDAHKGRDSLPHGKPLLGFSHGTSGILWVLYSFYKKNRDHHLSNPILRWVDAALTYERLHYSPTLHSWPRFDLPYNGNQYEYSTGWCHGAPGVGFSRLALIGYDNYVEQELKICVETTMNHLKHSKETSYCLCHGDYGNIEFILAVKNSIPGLIHDELFSALRRNSLDKIIQDRLENGIKANGNTIGLMTGVLGVAYQLLRLNSPGFFPSLLFPQLH